MQIVFCVDAVTCTMVYGIYGPRKQLFFDCRMEKTERQAGRQNRDNTDETDEYEEKDKALMLTKGEDEYKNVKSESNSETTPDWRAERGEEEWQMCCMPSIM